MLRYPDLLQRAAMQTKCTTINVVVFHCSLVFTFLKEGVVLGYHPPPFHVIFVRQKRNKLSFDRHAARMGQHKELITKILTSLLGH